MALPLRASRDQVVAFRLASHNLSRRLPPGFMLEAAAACGIQNTPPGSAALALNARVQDLTPAEFDRALETDRTLLEARSLRTAPHLFPSGDILVFTAGLLPEDEDSLRFFLLGACPALDRVGVSASEIVELTGAELLDALDGRILTFRELSGELTGRVSHHLFPDQLVSWQSPSWYGPNHCLGEAIVHFALYAVALKGLVCFAPRQGNEASFVRVDQWLGEPLPEAQPEAARAELVRRYLHCYGPSTANHFGEWAGISPIAASRIWNLIEPELVEVDFDGRRTRLHGRDVAAFESPLTTTGVRLLPPYDPYLSQRDRGTLLDRSLHRQIWKKVGNPGVVLVDGRISAMWRPQKKGRRLVVSIESIEPLTEQTRSEIAAEANLIAPFRGCTTADILFDD